MRLAQSFLPGKNGNTNSNAGEKISYPPIFRTILAIISVFDNAVLDESFSVVNPWDNVLSAVSQNKCSSVAIEELQRALGDRPSFTHLPPQIESDCQYGKHGTFQTSFGVNVFFTSDTKN